MCIVSLSNDIKLNYYTANVLLIVQWSKVKIEHTEKEIAETDQAYHEYTTTACAP